VSSLRSRVVFVFLFVEVNVRMRQTIVTVLVYVNFTARPRCAPECTDAQSNDHERNAKLEPATYPFRNRDAQRQHNDGNDQKGRCVSSAPERADKRRTKNILVPAHNRRNRHDVIDFRCVF